jgi:U6 snRNA-associated Sm-like protein LSm3
MILGDVEETITTVDIDDETYEEIIKVRRPRVGRALLSEQPHRPAQRFSLPPPPSPHTNKQKQTSKRTLSFLFVRGDGVILVSPPLRS